MRSVSSKFPKRSAARSFALLGLAICAAASPATEPTTERTSDSTTSPTTSPTPLPGGPVTLNFKDVPLETVLNFLSQRLGFIIMKDGPVEGNVTLMSRQPITADDAIVMLSAALKENGSAVTREGRLLRISPRSKIKKNNLPVHFGADPEQIPNTDEMITQVIPVQKVSALKLRDDLKSVIGPDADVAANEASNSLIISDTASSIRRIVQIIARLDEHEAAVAEIHIIRLRHANATATAKLIDTLFKPGGAADANAEMQQQMMMQQRGGQPGPPPPTAPHGDRVVTAADDRTNTLMVLAGDATFKAIESIVTSIDADNPNPAPVSEIRAFPLKFAEAVDAAKIITSIFKPPKNNDDDEYPFFRRFNTDTNKGEPPVNAVADERTNTVVVTAPSEKLIAIQKMLDQLDASPMVSGGLRVIHLKYADALDVSFLIEDMFKPKENDTTPRLPFYYFGQDSSESKAKGGKVTVTSDSRTNSLLISAPTELLDAIERVVKELDADPTTEDTLFIYHLRNSQADHLETVLNVLFGNVKNNQNQQGNQQQQTPDQEQGTNNNQLFSGRSVAGNNSSSKTNRNSVANRSNRKSNPANLKNVPANTVEAANELTGKVLVVADPDTNSLLVTTATKYETQVRRIIDDLDRAVPQVLIQVLIAEVTHENSEDAGLDFSVLNVRASGQGQSGGVNLGNAAANAANGGLVVSVLESNVSATLHALAVAQRLNVLSRPYILASDNQQASITVGDSVPFVQESRFDQNNNPINTVLYQDIGIVLNVTPHINPDGLVNMDVSPEISAFTQSTIQLSPGVTSPIFSTRSAQSRVGIMDGHTIVIGGLMQDRKTSTVQKVPILGDIPILGRVFSRVQYDKTKTELLIFLTPHVAARPEALKSMSQDMQNDLRLTPHAVAPGVYEEHMRGMQRGANPQTQPTDPQSPVDSIDLSDKSFRQSHSEMSTQPTTVPAALP